jgi:hypothetical protein
MENHKKIMEEIGLIKRTKLEKLADFFSNVRYNLHPDKENPDIGFIDFAYKFSGGYMFKEEKSKIEKVAEGFYNKDNYMVLVTTSDYGFSIIILDNFVKKAFKEVMKMRD